MSRGDLSRIVSLEPSVTATLFALEQEHRLVAVSAYCSRLVGVGERPQLSPTWSAQPEEIVALRPDLVIASVPYREETITGLLQAGLDVLCLYPKRLADVYAHIVWLGRLTGAEDVARRVVADMLATLEAVRELAGSGHRPRVYVEMWPSPLMSSPPWVAEMVEIAGAEFVPAGPGRRVSAEEVIAADPEIIVVAWAGVAEPKVDEVAERPGWHGISAVRRGRIVAVDEIWINAPGPNLAQGARLLAEAIRAGA